MTVQKSSALHLPSRICTPTRPRDTTKIRRLMQCFTPELPIDTHQDTCMVNGGGSEPRVASPKENSSNVPMSRISRRSGG